jgi:hypothetical protein
MARSHSLRIAAVVALSLSLALPARAAQTSKSACPPDKTMHKGKCVTACATDGQFQDPAACECPAGFGKILTGNGLGECHPLRCPANSPFAESKQCVCPTGYEKKPLKKGKVRCELPKTAAN